MNDYLVLIVRDVDQLDAGYPGGAEIVEMRVVRDASAADAKAAVKEITDRRPLYAAFTIKLS